MAYAPTNWVDGTTVINRAGLKNMEDELVLLDALPRIPAVVNGQWIKGVGGVPVWSAIAAGDLPDLSGTYQVRSEKGAVSGYASLDSSGKVPSGQLPVSGGGATQFPIDFRNPNAAASPGGAFPGIVVGTVWEEWAWHFIDSGFGLLYGIVRVPEDAVLTAPKLKFEFTGAAAGNAAIGADFARLVAGSSLNPATFTQQFTATVTLAAGRQLTRQTWNITGGNVVAGDLLIARFYRDGANAADTMVGDLALLGGWFSTV
jgi:hypothetical protein